MKYLALILLCSFLMCCNYKKEFAKIKEIQSDLQTAFNHQDVTTSLGWGTEQVNNNLTVTFFNYNLDSISYPELTNLASKIGARICERNPDFKTIDHFEVNFTKASNPKEATGMVTFNLKEPCK